MNKEEILAKSRMENKDQDIFEKEVMKDAANVGAITSISLCTVFFVLQIVLGEGINYGMWAIVFSMEAAIFTVKAIKLKKKHEIAISIMYIIATVLMSIAYIANMITASTI